MATRRRGGFGIALKIDLIIFATLAVGMGAVFFAFVSALVATRDSLSEDSLRKQADIIYTSIENFMLPGEAPIAVKFLSDLEVERPEAALTLWRRNGVPAFSDNATIRGVNKNLGKAKFAERPGTRESAAAAPPPRFEEAVRLPPAEVSYRQTEGDRIFFRVYRPLLNLPKCTGCHGSNHTIRGVIDIRSDITEVTRAQTLTVAIGGGGFAVMVAVIAVALGAFLRRFVLDPVGAIGRLCSEVAEGQFDGRVSVRNRDEIGALAETVNDMVQGLRERRELQKYVSSETMGAIGRGQESRREVRTILFSDVRGFTAYASSRDPGAVVSILNVLLESQTGIIHDHGGDVDKFVGDEVVAVFAGADAALRACRAALSIVREIGGDPAKFDGLGVGVGIATGPVIHGMVGSRKRADFTVIGDAANMGSRLCSLAKAGVIVVSDTTRTEAPDLSYKGPFAARIKGKTEPLRVWFLEGEGS